jgi:ubiquinone/menaquinone biosynthesis C-methylase UbiE
MSVANPRTSMLTGLIREHCEAERPLVLVVGCGRGIEAAVLAQDLAADVTGIDLDPRFDPEAARYAHLTLGDATGLAFPDGSFDIVYSFHALEHIPDYHKALDEVHRVLRGGGVWCIGTPNRARLLGYVGGNSTWRQKIAWNFADWRMRFTGRFRNEYGAHAGYTSGELREILAQHFSGVEEVTSEYYRRLYANRRAIISFLIGSGLGSILFPSVYFMGRK